VSNGIFAGAARGAICATVTAACMAATSASAGSHAVREAAEMAPSTVALAVLPPAASVADMQARETQGVPWPTHGWATSTPEAQGLDSAVLASVMETIRARRLPVHSLLIARHGRIVLDAYFRPFADNQLHDVASVTKSVISTLVGIAWSERKIGSLNTPLLALLPEARIQGDALKSRITLGHLLSMTSGLDCRGNGGGNFLQAMEQSSHWTDFALARDEVAAPGTTFTYCAGNMHLVSAVLSEKTGMNAAEFARDRLFEPLGIEHVSWAKDRDGISHGFSDLKLQPRDMAKLGMLWLHRGLWDGRQIVPSQYLDTAFRPHASVETYVRYGYGMWIYPYAGHAGGPADVEANGFGGQRIAVVPSQDMVVVITGSGLDANKVASLLVNAVRSDRPLPANPAAQGQLNVRVAEAGQGNRYRDGVRVASRTVQSHSEVAPERDYRLEARFESLSLRPVRHRRPHAVRMSLASR
jgi:CubicO group peptidase (beta-lactamase class C family)